MVNRLKGYITHPLFSGSAVMIVGTNLANFFAYIYHVVMGRLLGPAQYGELVAILSLVIIVSSTFSFLNLVIVKFVSVSRKKKLQGLFSWFAKRTLFFGTAVAVITLALASAISGFLHVETSLVILLAPLFMISIIGLVYISFLHGLMRFKEVVIVNNVNMFGRLLIGIVLVVLGYSVLGAIVGSVVAAILGVSLARYLLRDYKIFGRQEIDVRAKKVWKYGLPVLVSSIATLSFFSTDVVLVKHFFSSYEAGLYGSLSTLGKVIYFGVAPVTAVMFPMVSKRHAKGENFRKVFVLSFLISAAIALGIVTFYWVFPEFSIRILFGDKFLPAAPNLIWFSVFMSIFTLATLVVNYHLSIEKTKVSLLILSGALIQAVGIWLYHDSLLTVIRVSIIAATLLLTSLIGNFVYEARKA